MGSATPFTPEKLVMGILSSRGGGGEDVESLLVEQWGPIDYRSPSFPFTFTDYYDAEMGGPIQRSFVSFSLLVDPSRLAAIKRATNAIEDRFRENGRRTVNLDPGLMALSRFSLATTKENAHRIPLEAGIYAEITLLYSRKGFQPLDWTYPDYRSERYLQLLGEIRRIYKAQLGAARPGTVA
jgi:hypothetical protein